MITGVDHAGIAAYAAGFGNGNGVGSVTVVNNDNIVVTPVTTFANYGIFAVTPESGNVTVTNSGNISNATYGIFATGTGGVGRQRPGRRSRQRLASAAPRASIVVGNNAAT